MARHSHHGSYNPVVLRLLIAFLGVFLIIFIMGPPLYWHFGRNFAATDSCSPCVCDCSSETILSTPLGFADISQADCGKLDPDFNKEMEKDIIDLLSEELNLHRNVTNDSLEHIKASILEARKTSSQYQKEAEKCNAGVEACEEARERAEAELRAELKLSALWEKRARECGWKDQRRAFT